MNTTHQDAIETSPRKLWFESDGAQLFVVEVGSGTPVVFMHGGLADHRAALHHVGMLAGGHRLLCPDLRGSGRSHANGPLTWDRHADDLAALLHHLNLKDAIVGGTSMGSAVALRFALKYPQMVRGLLLLSPVYPGADMPVPEAATAAMKMLGELGQRATREGLEVFTPLYAGLPEPVRRVALDIILGSDAASVAATTELLASCEQPMGSAKDLRALDVPVLVSPGTDPQHPQEVASLYVKHLKRPTVVEAADLPAGLVRFCNAIG